MKYSTTVRCGQDDHRQRIGLVEIIEDSTHFERLVPTSGLIHARLYDPDEYDDDPWSDPTDDPFGVGPPDPIKRRSRADLSTELSKGEPSKRFSFTHLWASWSWPDLEVAAEMVVHPSRSHLWMETSVFWGGQLSDWLPYWCPRHADLLLYAVDIHAAMEKGKDVLAREIR